jgi:hypothetical protein
MKPLLTALAMMCVITAAIPANAERRFAVELRAGGGPSQEPDDVALDPGLGFEVLVEYRLMPHLLGYGGWDWHHFGSEESFAGANTDFEETGYAFGLRFEHPFSGEAGDGPAWWVRGGATVNHIEVENDNGDIIADSDHGLGWEAAGGMTFHVAERWNLLPGVRYRERSHEVVMSGTTRTVNLSYMLFELGIPRSF